MSEEIDTQSASLGQVNPCWNCGTLCTWLFLYPKENEPLNFPDSVSELGCWWFIFPHQGVLGKKNQSSTEPIGNCGASLWAPRGSSFCDVPLKGAFHVTLVPDITCSISLSVMGKGTLIAGRSNNIQLENIWLRRHRHSLKDPLKEGKKSRGVLMLIFISQLIFLVLIF